MKECCFFRFLGLFLIFIVLIFSLHILQLLFILVFLFVLVGYCFRSPHTSSFSLPVSLYLLTSRSSASSSPLEALTCARRLQLPFHLHFLFILLWLYLLSLYAEFVFSITNSTRSSVSNDTITSLCARPTAAYN